MSNKIIHILQLLTSVATRYVERLAYTQRERCNATRIVKYFPCFISPLDNNFRQAEGAEIRGNPYSLTDTATANNRRRFFYSISKNVERERRFLIRLFLYLPHPANASTRLFTYPKGRIKKLGSKQERSISIAFPVIVNDVRSRTHADTDNERWATEGTETFPNEFTSSPPPSLYYALVSLFGTHDESLITTCTMSEFADTSWSRCSLCRNVFEVRQALQTISYCPRWSDE